MEKPENNNGNGSPVKKPQVLISGFLFVFLICCILFDFQGKPLLWSVKPRAWTGFGESVENNSLTVTETTDGKTKSTKTDKHVPAKSLWDWTSLLLAPATLAGLGFWFQNLQIEAKQHKELVDKNAADEQAKQERELTADRQREEALQNYLNCLSELLVDKRLKELLDLQEKESEDKAAYSPSIDPQAALDIIKARTLSLLRLFDNDIPRKASVLSFICDAKLLNALNLDLSGSHWEEANLKRVNLENANLKDAKLNRAILKNTNLEKAKLNRAELEEAKLTGAILKGADLSNAKLKKAKLCYTNLSDANLSGADLSDANLEGANLSGADLSDANLEGANLSGVKVKKALFIKTVGLTEDTKRDLKNLGAIFEDFPGNKSEVFAGNKSEVFAGNKSEVFAGNKSEVFAGR